MAGKKRDQRLRVIDASEQRQYIQNGDYEVYEKIGAPVGATSPHYHDFYEIIYIAEGQFTSRVGETTHELRKGDFLLIGKNTLHCYLPVKRSTESRRIILWVNDRMLDALSDEEVALASCFREGRAEVYHFPLNYEDILSGILMKLAMTELINDLTPGMRRIMDRGYLTVFFAYLYAFCERTDYLFADAAIRENSIVDEADRYIDEHIEEPVTVEELAGQVHLSKYYFVRRFKELSGVTVHSYITHKRLMRACELLKEGEEVMSVFGQVGFSDYSVFLRNFRRVYGISPRQYARE